ncbi:Uncharacterised protein [Mycobacteroides abscessus subsp. abscessus]|nr:Uncharacterised protein [Mycobacteroides abscessus subsp. abscessus]
MLLNKCLFKLKVKCHFTHVLLRFVNICAILWKRLYCTHGYGCYSALKLPMVWLALY